MAGTTTVRVFGGAGIEHDGQAVAIGGARQRRLLALLTIRRTETVDLDWLAEYLWNDDERPAATAPAIRTYLSRLRQAMPDSARAWITTESAGYRFSPPADQVEHLRFRTLRSEARDRRDDGDPLAANGLLEEAGALLRGAPFRELDDIDWARVEIERLELERLEFAEERWEVQLELGRHTQITGELAAFTAQHAHRDRAVRQYALALHRSGRTADGLRVIERHRRALAEETGLDPSAPMLELEQALFADDPALAAEPPGRPLRGYRLMDEIGAGAFSIVWRGFQPSVGRDVAIKQIRAELASQPEFVRRFEAEAHIVARLEHPHIVPLVDFWREPDAAYLVMRWLRGGSLERRLDDGPLDVASTLTILAQIGDALGAAHRHGIVHRDVKPANILLDDDGRAYLSDFGIALDAEQSAGPEAALSPGSPIYSAPEQQRREQLGPPADVYSLGVVAAECLTGSPPRPGTPMSFEEHVPDRMAVAIRQAVSQAPGDRFASVADFLDAVEGADPAVGTDVGPAADVENPFLGLRAFADGDREHFYGRDRLVAEMVEQLSGAGRKARSIVVVGPSGSGKSSVVQAGLVPALRAGAVEGSSSWFYTSMVPGADPFGAMEAALRRVATGPIDALADDLRSGERGLVRAVRRCVADEGQRVALVIDQFEELFTMAPDDADDVLAALAVAIDDPTSPVRLIVTLRADRYDLPLGHPTFAPVLKETALDVTPLAGDELERAVSAPALAVGVAFEPGLVTRITADAHRGHAVLPLLQHALRELFDRRENNLMTTRAYEEIGGLTGALATRAESLFESGGANEQAAVRRVFGRLAAAGDTSQRTIDLRRRVDVAQLGTDPTVGWVLERYGDARLLTFDRDDSSREPTVEVAHEALLREWPRLVGWLRDDADVLRESAAIAAAADTWSHGGREDADLVRGARLDRGLVLLENEPERIRPVDHEFLEASADADARRRAADQRSNRRLRGLLAGVAVALVVALVAGGVAVWQQRRADDEAAAARAAEADALTQADLATEAEREALRQADIATDAAADAELATLISRSAAVATEDPQLGILLALEAAARAPGPETDQLVLNALGSSDLPNSLSSLGVPWGDDPTCAGVAMVSSDGERDFATRDGELVMRDLLSGEVSSVGSAPGDECVVWMASPELDRKFAYSPSASSIWAGAIAGPWSAPQRMPDPSFIAHQMHNPAGRVLVASPSPGEVGENVELRTVDDLTAETLATISFEDIDPLHAALDPTGRFLAFSFGIPRGNVDGDGRLAVVDAGTGDLLHEIATVQPITIFGIDGDSQLIGAGFDGSLTTIDLETGATVARLDGVVSTTPIEIGVSRSGEAIVVLPGEVLVVDRLTGPVGEPVMVPGGFLAEIRPDGLVTIVDEDGSDVIDIVGNALVERTLAIPPFASVGQRGGLVGVVTPGGVPQRIDLATGERVDEPVLRPDGATFETPVVVPEPDGVWAAGPGNEIARFEDGELVERLAPVSQSSDGRIEAGYVALFDVLADGSRQIRMVALERDALRVTFTIAVPSVRSVAEPTAEGELYVLTDDGVLSLYDADGHVVHRVDTGVDDGRSINPDPSSRRVAVPVGGTELVVIDAESGTQTALPIRGDFTNATFTPDGRLLALISSDGSVRLWDMERNDSAGLVWDGSGALGGQVSWVDEAANVLWVHVSGRVIAVPLDPSQWLQRACEIVGRPMTQAEWDRLVPGGGDVVDRCA